MDEDDHFSDDKKQKMKVVNPMHIISLRHDNSWGVRLAAKIRTISQQWFSHILLMGILCGYAAIGALIFYWLEKTDRCEVSAEDMQTLHSTFINDLFNINLKTTNKQRWLENARRRFDKYLQAAEESCEGQVQWTFWSSLFYCGTVLTTIGYGNIAPSTDAGRAVTIVYAFLGIPLMLMVLADLGKLFTKAIKYLFRYARRFYKNGTLKKMKISHDDDHKKPLQYMTVSWRTVSQNSSDPSKTKTQELNNCNQVTTLTLHNDDLYKDLDFLNADEANHKHIEMEDEFNLPVTLAVAMVLAYMVLGAQLFTLWEEWTFFEAFYFVFISMSTVGFGDYVPSNQTYMMAAFVYLVLGLTLTSMCINVIQEKLAATFQKAKVRIGNTIGLDVNSLLNEDGQKHGKYPYLGTPNNGTELNSLKKFPCNKESKAKGISATQTGIFENTVDQLEPQDGLRNGLLLNVPMEKRFTFYDSPYSTIQNENLYNTVSSINSLSGPQGRL